MVIAAEQKVQQWVVRMAALDQHPAGDLLTAGAPGHLQDQLAGMLRAAEVGTEKAAIGIKNHCQRQVRKMVPLGQHLGADQNRWRAAMHLLQRCIQAALAAGAVAVDPDHTGTGEARFQQLFQFFRAGAGISQIT